MKVPYKYVSLQYFQVIWLDSDFNQQKIIDFYFKSKDHLFSDSTDLKSPSLIPVLQGLWKALLRVKKDIIHITK